MENNTGSSKGVLITVVICAVCAALGMGIGIFNGIQIGKLSEDLSAMKKDIYGEDVDLGEDSEIREMTCALPKSAAEIGYLLIGYNNGDNQMLVDAEEGEIGYYITSGDETGGSSYTEQTIKTDVSGIMQQVFDNGLGDFGEYNEAAYDEEDTLKWDWIAEISTTDDHACQAGDKGAAPAWFNSLTELVNSKS